MVSPTTLPPSPVLSPMFDFFIPEEILPPHADEERIKDILNHLDELSLDHIEKMKDKIEGHTTRFISQHFFPPEKISPPKDAETPVESPILISPCSSVGSSSPFRSTTPPPDYPFDKSILDNSLWIIPQPLGSELVPEKPNESDAY
ncbi:hypothetical protein Tco_0660550 [Tanacetum coccineum]